MTGWSLTAATMEIDQETAGYIMVKVGPVYPAREDTRR
jgi:hypothetical protein